MFGTIILTSLLVNPIQPTSPSLNNQAMNLVDSIPYTQTISKSDASTSIYTKSNAVLAATITAYVLAQIADTEATLYHMNTPACKYIGSSCEWNPIIRPFVSSRAKLMSFKIGFSIPTIIAIVRAYNVDSPHAKLYTVGLASILTLVTTGAAVNNYCQDHPCSFTKK
jgi:hypothetical protein